MSFDFNAPVKGAGQGRTTIALSLTLFLFVAILLVGPVYHSNDDIFITALLKGLFGLAPGYDGVFISPLLGFLLGSAYALLNNIPWYSLLLYCGLAGSFFLACLIVLSKLRGWAMVAGFTWLVYLIGYAAMFPNFGAISLIMWGAGGAYLLFVLKRGMPVRGALLMLASCQMAVAYLLRPSHAPFFVVGAIPLFVFLLSQGSRRVVVRLFAPLFLVVVLGGVVGVFFYNSQPYSSYREFNQARSMFHDSIQGQRLGDNQALAAAEWGEDDYIVATNWWIHDGNVFSKEKIEKFLQYNSSPVSLFSPEMFYDSFKKNIYLILFSLCWVVIYVKSAIWKGINNFESLSIFLILLLIFVFMGIRFPARFGLPFFFLLFAYIVAAMDTLDANAVASHWRFSKTYSLLVPLMVCFIIYQMDLTGRVVNNCKARENYVDSTVDKILEVNGEDSVIVDVNFHKLILNYSPFMEANQSLLVPSLGGGWLVDTPAYLNQLKIFGLGSRQTAVPKMIDNRRFVMRFLDSAEMSFDGYVRGNWLRHLCKQYSALYPDKSLGIKIIKDFRQRGQGLVYFHLVTFS